MTIPLIYRINYQCLIVETGNESIRFSRSIAGASKSIERANRPAKTASPKR